MSSASPLTPPAVSIPASAPAGTKVIVGMSGGVDSSVAAHLLKEQGYQVSGLFMKNWEEDDGSEYCTAKEDLADAESVCQHLGIELHQANFAAEYWDNVFAHFLAEYRAGRTPNPDVLCNREIKFKAFLEYATELGADLIATGHYVRRQDSTEGSHLLKGADPDKDQSYFLCEVNEACIRRSLFPVGAMPKREVRQLAADLGLRTHDKKDSTGICFIGERRFKDFLERYLPAQPGDIETVDGSKIGRHSGLMYYTLGQRQGLGIGGQADCPEAPWYVVDKDLARNTLLVAQGEDNPHLLSSALLTAPPRWINASPTLPLQCTAKIRYRQPDQACTVSLRQPSTAPDSNASPASTPATPTPGDSADSGGSGGLHVAFATPQRAATPGQYAVFYNGDKCLGGAVIEQILR